MWTSGKPSSGYHPGHRCFIWDTQPSRPGEPMGEEQKFGVPQDPHVEESLVEAKEVGSLG